MNDIENRNGPCKKNSHMIAGRITVDELSKWSYYCVTHNQ